MDKEKQKRTRIEYLCFVLTSKGIKLCYTKDLPRFIYIMIINTNALLCMCVVYELSVLGTWSFLRHQS